MRRDGTGMLSRTFTLRLVEEDVRPAPRTQLKW